MPIPTILHKYKCRFGSTDQDEKRLSTRRLAIVPDTKTVAEIKHVAANIAGKTASTSIRFKRQLFARASRLVTLHLLYIPFAFALCYDVHLEMF